MNKKYRSQIAWGVALFLCAAAAIACYFLFLRWEQFKQVLSKLSSVLSPVTVGVIIAFLLDSMVRTFIRLMNKLPPKGNVDSKKRQKVEKVFSILLSELVLCAAISLVIGTLIPQIITSIRTIIANFNQYIRNIEEWAEPFLEEYPEWAAQFDNVVEQTGKMINDFLNNDLMKLIGSITNQLLEIGEVLYNFIIGIIVSIYLLAGKHRLLAIGKKLVYAFFPVKHANRLLITLHQGNHVFKGFLIGKLLDSLIIGVLCFIGVSVFRIPYALLISMVVGVTNIIPYFGPFIGAIPSLLLVLMVNPYKALIFLIFIVILQQVDGNVIGPKILGTSIGISSLGVLFSILVGGGMFGLTGMILGVPAFTIICSLLRRLSKRLLTRQGMPVPLTAYMNSGAVEPTEPVQEPSAESADDGSE